MATPLEDDKRRPRILQYCPERTTMETFLETVQASENRSDNCIDNSPTTTGTWLFQVLPNTPSKLQLHPMPMF